MAAAHSFDIGPLISAPELSKFILTEVEPTGRSLGASHHGVIEELFVTGTRRAGKRLHTENTQIKFQNLASECELLNNLRHPNIIRFFGLCFLPSPGAVDTLQPVMVLEYLENDLYHLLDEYVNVNLSTKVSILLDVAKGLMYLHSHEPPIVHGDLTSSSILLTESFQAKIGNLESSQSLFTRSRVRSSFASFPGTVVYMPPEASDPKAQCNVEIDIFSFGVIVLHTVTQVFPGDLPAPKYTDEGLRKSKVLTRTEIQRRAPYLEIAYDQLGEDHVLSQLMYRCLQNDPKDRPTASNIKGQLEGVKAMLKNMDDAGNKASKNVQFRRGVRFDSESEGSSEIKKAEMKLRHQSMSFMHTHVLHGHPSVLFKFKLGGGFAKRRSTGEWQQFVFKLVDNTLQCLSLKEKLQSEIDLMDVKEVKAYRSPNSQMFPFHVHFKGKDSPWILSANSQEERLCWMEAINPGSTHNQWANTFPQQKQANRSFTVYSPPSLDHTDHPIIVEEKNHDSPQQPRATDEMEGPASTPNELPDVKVTVRNPTPPPRSEISLQLCESYDPYVKANEVLAPLEKQESSWRMSKVLSGSKDHSAGSETPIYLKLLPPDETLTSISQPQSPQHSCHYGNKSRADSDLSYEIVAELEEQFTPLEMDLLVKMFDKHPGTTKAHSKVKGRRKSADESIFKKVEASMFSPTTQEDSSHSYIRLVDLMQNYDDVNQVSVRSSEQDTTAMPGNFDASGIAEETCQLPRELWHSSSSLDTCKLKSHGCYVTSESNPRHAGSLKEGSLLRQNAVRQRKATPSQPKETVTHLRKLLRKASSEDFLDEDEEKAMHPFWSKADANESDTLRLGLMSLSLDEKEVFIPHSDLQRLMQIQEGRSGPVYRATLKQMFSTEVVAKSIQKSLTKRVELNSYIHELNILMKNSHPNVAQLYGIVLETKMIVMRYFPLGNLKTFLCKNSRSTDQLVKYMLDIAMGMHHITDKLKLVHRNLAAHNVFITEQGVCQVADMDIGLNSTADCGTSHYNPSRTRWMAPESLLNGHYSAASDVWSYGITIWEVLNPTSTPYGDCDAKHCLEHITKGYVLAVSPACPDVVVKIMRACWLQSPTKRPSFLYISHLLSTY